MLRAYAFGWAGLASLDPADSPAAAYGRRYWWTLGEQGGNRTDYFINFFGRRFHKPRTDIGDGHCATARAPYPFSAARWRDRWRRADRGGLRESQSARSVAGLAISRQFVA
jgi:hypothetical protein